jgi:hypothetical protein
LFSTQSVAEELGFIIAANTIGHQSAGTYLSSLRAYCWYKKGTEPEVVELGLLY